MSFVPFFFFPKEFQVLILVTIDDFSDHGYNYFSNIIMHVGLGHWFLATSFSLVLFYSYPYFVMNLRPAIVMMQLIA